MLTDRTRPGSSPGKSSRWDRGSYAADFHTYAVQWSPDSLIFSIDGRRLSAITPSTLPAGDQWVFDKPMYLLLNLAVGGDGPAIPPSSSTALPATMLVDWVRVYAP